MKKCLYVIAFGILLSACAGIKTFNDSDVSIYFGRLFDISGYFYLNNRNNFYMLDVGNVVEIGQCRISHDTLYCYPRQYKLTRSDFKQDTMSYFFVVPNEGPDWKELSEVKYLIDKNRLYFLTAIDSTVYSFFDHFPEDAFFEKIEIKDDPKYQKKVLLM